MTIFLPMTQYWSLELNHIINFILLYVLSQFRIIVIGIKLVFVIIVVIYYACIDRQ